MSVLAVFQRRNGKSGFYVGRSNTPLRVSEGVRPAKNAEAYVMEEMSDGTFSIVAPALKYIHIMRRGKADVYYPANSGIKVVGNTTVEVCGDVVDNVMEIYHVDASKVPFMEEETICTVSTIAAAMMYAPGAPKYSELQFSNKYRHLLEVHPETMVRAYIPYGSHFYGESRDEDVYAIILPHGLIPQNCEQQPASKPDIVFHSATRDAFKRLVLECIKVEYPEIYQYVSGQTKIEVSLLDAANENAKQQTARAKYISAAPFVAKAVFAQAQLRSVYANDFVDTKSKALAYVPPEIRDVAARLFAHEETSDDTASAYYHLFGAVPPNDIRTYIDGTCVVTVYPDGNVVSYSIDSSAARMRENFVHIYAPDFIKSGETSEEELEECAYNSDWEAFGFQPRSE